MVTVGISKKHCPRKVFGGGFPLLQIVPEALWKGGSMGGTTVMWQTNSLEGSLIMGLCFCDVIITLILFFVQCCCSGAESPLCVLAL